MDSLLYDRVGTAASTCGRRAALLALGCLPVAACVPPAPPTVARVHVAPDLDIALPAPSSAARSLRVEQLVTAQYGDQVTSFQAYLRIADDNLRLACVDGLGRVAIMIRWSDQGIAAQAEPWVPADLKPQNILADIVLIYWPETVVRAMLAAGGATLAAGPGQRVISRQGQDIIRILYQTAAGQTSWDGGAAYRNLAFGYRLDIRSHLIAS